MLFAIDVGNTNFTIGLFDGKELVKTFRMITKTSRTSDEFGVFFGEWLMLNGFSIRDIDSVIIISQKWHNERSIYLADKMGIHAIGYNAKDARNTRTFLTHIREKLARVKIFIDIYITNRKDFNL